MTVNRRIGLVEALEQRLTTIWQLNDALGVDAFRQAADNELRLVTDLLKQCSYVEEFGERLFGVAAELGRMAGWSSFNPGRNAAAERYFHMALRAAHSANDRPLGAHALRSVSLHLAECDRVTEALAVANVARTYGQEV